MVVGHRGSLDPQGERPVNDTRRIPWRRVRRFWRRPLRGERAGRVEVDDAPSEGPHTTHTIASAIMGAGATRRFNAVRWGVARSIVIAWVLTFPLACLMEAVAQHTGQPWSDHPSCSHPLVAHVARLVNDAS
jgi:hypothetical protein